MHASVLYLKGKQFLRTCSLVPTLVVELKAKRMVQGKWGFL